MSNDLTPPLAPARRWLPQLKSRWWTLLLGLSLMVNLLIGGMVLGRLSGHRDMERLAGVSYVQLIPRRFLQELPGERRKEMMEIIRLNRPDLRNLREATEANSVKLADVLEKPNFSLDEVRATIREFATGTESLAAKGGDVVVDIVAKLTPEERKNLASTIRERGRGRKKR
jgi:Heavy-metal resistance